MKGSPSILIYSATGTINDAPPIVPRSPPGGAKKLPPGFVRKFLATTPPKRGLKYTPHYVRIPRINFRWLTARIHKLPGVPQVGRFINSVTKWGGRTAQAISGLGKAAFLVGIPAAALLLREAAKARNLGLPPRQVPYSPLLDPFAPLRYQGPSNPHGHWIAWAPYEPPPGTIGELTYCVRNPDGTWPHQHLIIQGPPITPNASPYLVQGLPPGQTVCLDLYFYQAALRHASKSQQLIINT